MTIPHFGTDRGSGLAPRPHWKAVAVAAFSQRADASALRAGLAQRLHALIDSDIALEHIWVDPATLVAGVTLDGVRFRWEHGQLGIVRPCVHCGVGSFTSPPVHSLADIGHALSAWQPRHGGCEPNDPTE